MHSENLVCMIAQRKSCVYDCRAANFSVEELPEVMGYLRARGVKGYVALNILVSL
jgi:collagenase-like PrtC family protease